ncbi:dTDP-4-dehydrorhamnose reductase [Azomonas macrocytogenes]|uniref:dTDP-4-dehydrorhamnose reductase n=1 Tax=Azomonas macrocytogenes TaxID=69962 RepID=A0A839T4F0_AZOMA|nr:dTDP-4-dehydrorhamnose reductase [Azomonas macrocytogenes]MBB3102593.1 dTDP-4-dehydrorhamnose reductase [Azomonas macrocytogenes]
MKIMITGSKGQVSQELQLALAGQGEIFAFGSHELNLAIPEDISRKVRELRPDLILNPAAYTAVDKAETDRQQAFAVNAIAPGRLAEEAAQLGIPLIHYSTDYVFNGRKSSPYNEDDQPDPLNAYGESKLAGEQAIQAVGGEGLILRTSWVYSLHGKNFLLTMQRLLQEREQLSIVDDEIGAPTWAGTIASITAQLIRRWQDEKQALKGLYHLTSTGETSWNGFATSIGERLKELNKPCARIERISSKDYPSAARRPLNSRLDCSRLQREWNVHLPHWESALSRCLEQSVHPNIPLTA